MCDKKVVIYTCITGGYDIPTDGFERKEGYEYILFSDIPLTTKSWNNVTVSFDIDGELSNVKKQRLIKTHPHNFFKDFDVVVWIDANTSINDKLYKYIEENADNRITFKNHPNRNCIYDEIDECIKVGKEKREVGENIKKRYKSEGYPKHNGLYETNIIISHPRNDSVAKLFDAWWKQVREYSHRDQFSLNYVIWKNHFEDIVTAKTSSDFKPKPHIKLNISQLPLS